MQIQEVEKEEKVIKKAKGWTRLHGEVECVSRLLTCAGCHQVERDRWPLLLHASSHSLYPPFTH